jgi:hypothetical protein
MIRKRAFEACGGYDPELPLATDVDLIVRIAAHGRVLVIPEALYRYRYNPDGLTNSTRIEEITLAKHLLRRSIAVHGDGRRDGVPSEAAADAPPPSTVANALYYQGAMRLWAGQRPKILAEAIRSDARELSPAWMRTLAFAAWGSVSPGSLRAALRAGIRVRDAAAGAWLDDGKPVEWRPG